MGTYTRSLSTNFLSENPKSGLITLMIILYLNPMVQERILKINHHFHFIPLLYKSLIKTRSSWLNCALRDDEAVYWVIIGHYEAVAVGN